MLILKEGEEGFPLMQGEEPNNSVVVCGWSRSSLEREEVVEIGIGTWAEVRNHTYSLMCTSLEHYFA